jgi:hypothetical protein
MEATIRLKLRVEVINYVMPTASGAHLGTARSGATVDDQTDDDLIETAEARPEDYLDRK